MESQNNVIVEFMGCSSVGKTTLAEAVRSQLIRENIRTDGTVGRESTAALALRNFSITPMMGLRAASSRDSRRHLSETTGNIRDCDLSAFWTLARIAAGARVIGEHSMRADKATNGLTTLVDEGIMTTVQLAFARRAPAPNRATLAFAETVPLADLVVWLDASPEMIVDRTLQRSDPPREWRALSKRDVCLMIDNTLCAYRTVASSTRVRDRMVAIQCRAGESAATSNNVALVVDAISSVVA